MPQVRLSSKGQVVLPKEIRKRMKLVPGKLLEVNLHEGRIVIEPALDPIETLCGMFKGKHLLKDLEEERARELAKEEEKAGRS